MVSEAQVEEARKAFEDAKTDWKTVTYSLDEFRQRMNGVVFANPI